MAKRSTRKNSCAQVVAVSIITLAIELHFYLRQRDGDKLPSPQLPTSAHPQQGPGWRFRVSASLPLGIWLDFAVSGICHSGPTEAGEMGASAPET